MELLILSTLTGLMIFVGVIGVLLFGQPGKKVLAFYLGLAAGMMVLVVLVDLLPTAFDEGPFQAVGMGLGLGIGVMLVVHRLLHEMVGDESVSRSPKLKEYRRMGWMITLAILFHNIPEGIAIGTGFESHHQIGTLVALSIAIHNIPSGIGMAIPFVMADFRKKWILVISFLVSLCIPLGAWVGKVFLFGSAFSVSMGLAFAAGAMGYIVWKELAPTSFKQDKLVALLGMAVSIFIIYFVHGLR